MTSAESVVPAGGVEEDDLGRARCGFEHIVEVTEMEIALTTRDLTRALVGYVSDAIHREND